MKWLVPFQATLNKIEWKGINNHLIEELTSAYHPP